MGKTFDDRLVDGRHVRRLTDHRLGSYLDHPDMDSAWSVG
jgi:hypothetical protein